MQNDLPSSSSFVVGAPEEPKSDCVPQALKGVARALEELTRFAYVPEELTSVACAPEELTDRGCAPEELIAVARPPDELTVFFSCARRTNDSCS